MTKQRLIFITIIIALSLLSSLFFYLGFNHPIAGDAYQHKIITQNLLSGRGFSLSEEPPYLPTAFREPIYPIFLAFLLWLFRGNYAAIYLTQIIMFSLTVVWVYYLSLKILGERIARWTAILTALCPTLANHPSYLLSETFFTFLIVLFMMAILKAVETNRIAWYICSGLLLGCAALTKHVVTPLFIPIVFSGLLYCGNFSLFLKKYLKNFMIFTMVSLTVIIPWPIRNYAQFGKFSLSLRLGMLLGIRSAKLDYDFADIKKEAVFSFSEYLGGRLYPEVKETNLVLINEYLANEEKTQEWAKQGYNEAEIDQMQIKQALAKIRHRPLKYLTQNFLEWLKMSAFLYIPTLNEPHIIEHFRAIKNGQLLLSALRGAFRILAFPVLFLALLGFWGERRRWRQWVFIAALVIYMNVSHTFIAGSARYGVPLIPFYFMFAVAGVIFIKDKLCCQNR